MRTRISTSQAWKGYVFLGISLAIFYFITRSLMYNKSMSDPIIQAALIIEAISILGFKYYSRRKDIEFDNEYLYIVANKEKHQIPIGQVTKIKRTMTKFNNRDTWKIYHLTPEGKENNIRLLPQKKRPEHFETFKAYVNQVNPDLIIDNKARTL